MSSLLETDVTVFMSTGIGTVNLPLLTPLNNDLESEEGRHAREQWEKGEVKNEAIEREVLTSKQLHDKAERQKKWRQREALVIEKYKSKFNGSLINAAGEIMEEVKDRLSNEMGCNTRVHSPEKSCLDVDTLGTEKKKVVEAVTSRKFDAVPKTDPNEDIVNTSQLDEKVSVLNKKTVFLDETKDNPTENSFFMSESGEALQLRGTHKETNFKGQMYMEEEKDKASVETSGIDIKEHSQSIDKNHADQVKDQRSMTDEKVNDSVNHLRIDVREQPLSKDKTCLEKEADGPQQGSMMSTVLPIVTILVGAVFFFYYGIPSR